MPQRPTSSSSPVGLSNVPPGYISFKHEGREFVIPEICLPHSLHAFAAHRTKSVINVPHAEPTVCIFSFPKYYLTNRYGKLAPLEELEQTLIAGGLFQLPPNPVRLTSPRAFKISTNIQFGKLLSAQEKLALHSEVLALQAQLGISYKDASHRLYMAEMEKLRLADNSAKAWRNLSEALKSSLEGRTVIPDADPEGAQDPPRGGAGPDPKSNDYDAEPEDDDDYHSEDSFDGNHPEHEPSWKYPDVNRLEADAEPYWNSFNTASKGKQARRGTH